MTKRLAMKVAFKGLMPAPGLLLAFACMLLPSLANAASLDQCAAQFGSFQPWELTTKIVACIEGSIQQAVVFMLISISTYMQVTTGTAFLLAMAVFGMRILGGERDLKPKAMGVMIRIGIVAMFSFALGGWAGYVFGIFHQLIALLVGGWSPWQYIDYFLGQLLGFGAPGITLLNGIIGLIGGAALASSMGAMMAFAGIMAVLNLLLFILDVLYTYLSAVIVLGFLIVISPLIIPLGVFYYTERYVKKWIDIVVSTMLMPALMFAFLYISITIFSFLIADVFEALGAPCTNKADLSTCPMRNLSGFWKSNQPMFSWLVPSDPNMADQLQGITATSGNNFKMQKTIPSVQTMINPMLNRSVNTNQVNSASINFGRDNLYIMQRLTFSFITLWLFAHLMKAMIYKIPEIASSISSVSMRIPISSGSLQSRIDEANHNVRVGAGAVLGGTIGGEAGAAVGRAAGVRGGIAREIGGMIGGVGGAIFGGKR